MPNLSAGETKIVTAAIVRRAGKILLTRRGPGDKFQGYWEFPGGKLESGESLQECLEREMSEELGISSTAGPVLCSSEFTYDHGSITLLALETTITSESFVPTVHDRIEWVDPDELLTYKLLPADIPVAEFIFNNSRL